MRRRDLIKKEKETVVYYQTLKENKALNKGKVTLEDYVKKYEELFPMKSKNPYSNTEIDIKKIENARKESYITVQKFFQEKTIEDVLAYRNTLMIVENRTIPEDLSEMAKSKNLFLKLQNVEYGLSGYSVFYKKHCITNRPYQLDELEVREIVEKFPTSKEALVKQENDLLDLLHDESVERQLKLFALNDFQMIYTTHDFQKRINHYLFKYCTDKSLALAAIELCARAGIVNMSNNRPIMFRYCKASDNTTRKNIKKARRRKGKK